MSDTATDLALKTQAAKVQLDAHVREIVEWHFNPATGCPFWLDQAAQLGWDPRREINAFEDLRKFPPFQDEWLRGGPVRRWLPKGLEGQPLFTFETGGTNGVPKSIVSLMMSIRLVVKSGLSSGRYCEGVDDYVQRAS